MGHDKPAISHNLTHLCLTSLSSLSAFQAAMREASRSLSAFLEGKAHFATANIQVPADWTAADCQTPLEHNKPIRSEVRLTRQTDRILSSFILYVPN